MHVYKQRYRHRYNRYRHSYNRYEKRLEGKRNKRFLKWKKECKCAFKNT